MLDVKKKESAISEPASKEHIWVSTNGHTHYLNGLTPGDTVLVYDILGKQILNFSATTSRQPIEGKGIKIIKVITSNRQVVLKSM